MGGNIKDTTYDNDDDTMTKINKKKEEEELLFIACLEAQDGLLIARRQMDCDLSTARYCLTKTKYHLATTGSSVLHATNTHATWRAKSHAMDELSAALRVKVEYHNNNDEDQEGEEEQITNTKHHRRYPSFSPLHAGTDETEEEGGCGGDWIVQQDKARLRWFAALPPPALREAQVRFKQVFETLVLVANMQLKAHQLREKYLQHGDKGRHSVS